MSAPQGEHVRTELARLARYYARNEETGDIVHYPSGMRPRCRRWIAECKCILPEHDDDRHQCECGGKWCATEDDTMSRFDPEWAQLPGINFNMWGGLFND